MPTHDSAFEIQILTDFKLNADRGLLVHSTWAETGVVRGAAPERTSLVCAQPSSLPGLMQSRDSAAGAAHEHFRREEAMRKTIIATMFLSGALLIATPVFAAGGGRATPAPGAATMVGKTSHHYRSHRHYHHGSMHGTPIVPGVQ
jgi:hypothetical protein